MVGDLLTETGVPNAVIDLDWLRRSWPSPTGDRFNVAMALRNLRSVARNYQDAGAVRIVLAGVIETRDGRDRHEDALGFLSRCVDFAWTWHWCGPDSHNDTREKVPFFSGIWLGPGN